MNPVVVTVSFNWPPFVLATVTVRTRLGSARLSPSVRGSNTGGPAGTVVPAVVGGADVATWVAGDTVVDDAVVGDAVVAETVIGETVVGDSVDGDSGVGDGVGTGAVDAAVGSLADDLPSPPQPARAMPTTPTTATARAPARCLECCMAEPPGVLADENVHGCSVQAVHTRIGPADSAVTRLRRPPGGWRR